MKSVSLLKVFALHLVCTLVCYPIGLLLAARLLAFNLRGGWGREGGRNSEDIYKIKTIIDMVN